MGMDKEDTGRGLSEEGTKKAKPKRPWRLLGRALACAFVLMIAIFLGIQWHIKQTTASKTFTDITRLDDRYIGLVFGCDDQFQGRDNLYFKYRIEAAAALWHAGKIECFIVSGDNRHHNYNEPKKMRKALVAKGVPDNKIVCDYAGLRTLDSVVRAKKVFGVESCLMISQQFQNERAIYLAEAQRMTAIGFNAKDVEGSGGRKTRIRELGARVMMWLDVHVLNTQPKHLGPRENLPM